MPRPTDDKAEPLLDSASAAEHGLMAHASTSDEDMPTIVTTTSLKAWDQITTLMKLIVPIFLSRIAWVGMNVTDTSLVGHTGSLYLDAVALQSLWTSATGVFLSASAFGILGAQAVGGGHKELLGIWLQVSLAVNTLACVVVVGTWAVTGPFLRATGANESLVWPAWYYALVLASSLPARMLNSQINQFFQSQKIMWPGVFSSTLAVVLNLCFGLVFVLGWPFDPNPSPHSKGGYGFWACPIVTVAMEHVQLIVMTVVFVRHLRGAGAAMWPGWRCAFVCQRADNGVRRLWTYLKLWLPLVLSSASDFWRVSVIGIVAAGLGNDQLGVFNASYRILWICLTFAGSVAYAMGILLGQALGAGKAGDAKFITRLGLVLVFFLLSLLGAIVALFPAALGRIFTSEQHIIDLFVSARWPLAATMVLMNFAVALERVPAAMGKGKVVLFFGLVGSWVGQVPFVFLFTKCWRNDLVGLYTGMATGYGILCCCLLSFILRVNWVETTRTVLEENHVKKKKKQEGAAGDDAGNDEATTSM